MRKDVRFGLAIGGSLLALLVICAALFDRGPATNPEIALQPQPGDSPTTVAPIPAAPIDTHANDISAKNDTGTTTRPSGGAALSSTARDWNLLLASGDGDSPTTRPTVIHAGYTEMPTSRPADGKLSAARTHKIAAGETLITIAASVYGDGKYYTSLEDANPTINPNRLHVGTVINVPALGDAMPLKSAATRQPSGAADSTTPIDSSKSYRVRPSDTLMAIARRLYGDGQAWQKIYDANKDMIGANPARLTVGMVLRLPSPPTVAPAN